MDIRGGEITVSSYQHFRGVVPNRTLPISRLCGRESQHWLSPKDVVEEWPSDQPNERWKVTLKNSERCLKDGCGHFRELPSLTIDQQWVQELSAPERGHEPEELRPPISIQF